VIAFGCNLGDCKGQIERALKLLSKEVFIRKLSPIVISEPYGVKNQPKFHNGVLYGFTELKPYDLLRFLKEVEKLVGRVERCRWCEMEIDLDIVYYDGLILSFDDLTIPHLDRLNRDFVLKPLAEILPAFVDPVVGRSIKELIR